MTVKRQRKRKPLVLSVDTTDNASIIAGCAQLGWLHRSDKILDPTYGRGAWWRRWAPEWLWVLEDTDFRCTAEDDDYFDAATFDPPYVSTGGRETSTVEEFNDRYGLIDTPKSPLLLQELVINPGLAEMARIVRPRGIIIAKCMDYVSSGKLWCGTYQTRKFAESIGLVEVDNFVLAKPPRMQPQRKRQVHSRRNFSELIVFRNTVSGSPTLNDQVPTLTGSSR